MRVYERERQREGVIAGQQDPTSVGWCGLVLVRRRRLVHLSSPCVSSIWQRFYAFQFCFSKKETKKKVLVSLKHAFKGGDRTGVGPT